MKAPDRVVLGRVAGAHALRGEIRVRYFGEGPRNLLQFPEVWLGRDREDPDARRFAVVRTGSGRAGEVRLALRGVDDRDDAAALRGLFVLADVSCLEPLPDGEFYWHELIGCAVVGRDGSEIGTVQEIWDTGAHDLLVVENGGGERYLLSTARELMPEVDLEAGRIIVELLPGMLAPVPRESH